jgi:UrcA family protein
MTRTSIIARPLCTFAAALVAVPLAAQESVTVTGQPVLQERVSYADLDLRGGSARQTLKVRVYRAADRLCALADGPFPNNQFGLGSAPTCAELTYADAQPQIRAAIDRANSRQPEMATNLVVSTPRVR